MEHRGNRPTPDPEQNQSPTEAGQSSTGFPMPQLEVPKTRPQIIETTRRTGTRYLRTREEALEHARWYMQNRARLSQEPRSEEEIERERERFRLYTEYLTSNNTSEASRVLLGFKKSQTEQAPPNEGDNNSESFPPQSKE